VAVEEAGEQILFLHRLRPGGADRSYGIEVGRLAGLPAPVITRARALLKVLEGEQLVPALAAGARRATPAASGDQLALFTVPHPLVERLREVDPNGLTPLQALALLAELAAEARGDA
jgi:DNA mismatch repair protein MutS